LFPVDVNTADYHLILRIPGVGLKSAKKIVAARKFGALRYEHLEKFGVVLKRAKYFLICADRMFLNAGKKPELIRQRILHDSQPTRQLSLF
jgi:predicted DNA-binding helix-hairpin-helix protein